MVETWASDLLQWKGFIGDVIASYQIIVHPVFQYLLGWLPFVVPTWLIDYYFINAPTHVVHHMMIMLSSGSC